MLTHIIWSESETFSCLSPSSVINLVYTFTHWFLSLKWGTHSINDASKYKRAHFHSYSLVVILITVIIRMKSQKPRR